jgi:peptide/nickel transport system substrate-binding protein
MVKAAGSYWSRYTDNRWSRRTFLKVGGMTAAGLAGAGLLGCGGGSGNGGGGSGSLGGKSVTDTGAVLRPGIYEGVIPASQEEANWRSVGKRGDTWNFLSLDPPHLDMATSLSCTVYNVNDMVYNKLVRGKMPPDGDSFKVELEPDLAESWEIKPDGMEVTFHLRKGVQFQNVPPTNGREFTAEDARLSFERYKSSGVQKDFFAQVGRIEAPDNYTLKVVLDKPFAGFVGTTASYSFIFPKELATNDPERRKTAVGTGAFVLDKWTPKEGVQYSRNPNYFEKGLPFLDKANMFVIPDDATALAAYRSRQIDVPPGGAVTTKIQRDDVMKSDPDTVIQILPISRGGNVNGLQWRLDKSPWKDERARRALSMAIDRKAFADNQYDGLGGGFSSPAIPWSFVFDQPPTLADQGQWYQFNPSEAKKLWSAAGAGNVTGKFVSWYQRNTFQLIQQMWKANLGFEVDAREVDNPTHITILTQRNYEDMVGIVWGPPNYELDGWVYPYYRSDGGLNYNFVNDSTLDQLLDKQRVELDNEKRKQLFKQLWDYLNDKVYEIWWPQNYYIYGWRSIVRNFRQHGLMGTSSCYTTGNVARRVWIDRTPIS